MALLTTASALVAPRPLTARRATADAQGDDADGPQGHHRQHLRAAAAAAARDGGRGRRELPAARRAAERRVRRGPAGGQTLKEKYAGDTKRLLKIDVAKDKIAELRLRQRVSGTFGVTAEVAASDKTIGDFAARESQAMNRAIAKNTPKWIRKIPYMYKPFWKIDELYSNRKDRELQRARTKTAGLYWCGFAAAATFFPGRLLTSSSARPSSSCRTWRRGASRPSPRTNGAWRAPCATRTTATTCGRRRC